MKKFSKKVLAVVLSVILVSICIPFAVFAKDSGNAKLQIGSISDIHMYAPALLSDDLTTFLDDHKGDIKQFEYTDQLLQTALYTLEEHAKENNLKYIIVPGDLSKDGENVSHQRVAELFANFEERTGIQIYVINGNHDINNSSAITYVSGSGVADESLKTSPEEFKEIYAEFGYNEAYHTYTPPTGEKAGMLSYSVKLPGNYRLIAMDTCKYSADATEDAVDEHETAGFVSESLMTWIKAEIADAKADGETVIGLCHHGIVAHHDIENNILKAFVVDDWESVATEFANAGMHYVFTGHQHSNDIASYISEDGETIFDCETDGLACYPHYFKEVLFDNTMGDGKVSADFKTYKVDCEKKMVDLTGNEIPSFEAFSFQKTLYRDGDISTYFDSILANYVITFINNLNDEYSLGLDSDQIYKIAVGLVDRLKTFKVSDIPSTKFESTLGFKDDSYGTLSSAILSAWSYNACGDENISDDAFMQDAIEQCRNGDVGVRLVGLLMQGIYEEAGGNPDVFSMINGFYASFSDILRGIQDSTKLDTSSVDISSILGTSSIPELDNSTVSAFLSNPRLLGELLAYAIECFSVDVNPGEQQDNSYVHSYTGKIDVSNSGNEESTTNITNNNSSGTSANNGSTAGINPDTGIIGEPKDEFNAKELLFVLPICALALVTAAIVRKKKEEA